MIILTLKWQFAKIFEKRLFYLIFFLIRNSIAIKKFQNVFMNTLNLEHYGHLIDGDSFNSVLTRPDMYMLSSNQADWEQRYIHPDYVELLKENATFKQVIFSSFLFE